MCLHLKSRRNSMTRQIEKKKKLKNEKTKKSHEKKNKIFLFCLKPEITILNSISLEQQLTPETFFDV